MHDLYECSALLRMPSKVSITQCISGEDVNGFTLVLYCNNYHLLYYHLNKCQSIKDNNKPIVRQIPIDKRRGELCSMCLSPTASQLMIIVSNSTVYVIPIESLISRQNDHILRDDAIVINTCSLSNPTAIVWWPSLDHFNQTAIIGNDFGDICFVDIKSKRQIGSTSVHDSIKELNIIDDKSSVSLIIMCKNETQYRLVLEETRNRSLPKNKLDSQLPAHDSHYFNCFITAPEDREPIGPNNCWNFKPISMNALKESNITENEEILTTTLVYQNPLILCLFETMSETKEKFGEIIVKLFTNKEFEYNLSTFSAKYLMPKQSSLPINGICLTDKLFFMWSSDDCVLMSREFSDSKRLAKLNPLVQKFAFKESERVINCFKFIHKMSEKSDEVLDSFAIVTTDCLYVCRQKQSLHQLFHSIVTSKQSIGLREISIVVKAQRFGSMFGLNLNTLYEKSAQQCLQRREFSPAIRFYQLAKTPQTTRIAQMMSNGFISETIAYIQNLFSTKIYELEDSERMQFANIAIKCLIQQLLQKQSTAREPIDVTKLKTFLKECLYFDESIVLCLLVEEGLFHLAQYCAQLRAQNGLLIQYLLNSSHLRSKALNDNTYEIVMQSIYRDIFDETNEWTHYLNCFTSPQITYSLILRKELISKYMTFMIKLLPTLEMPFLTRLAVVFDPRRSSTQLLLNRVLTQLKQTYLNYESEDSDQQIIEKKDVLNFFIFVVLMIIRQNRSISTFDDKFVSIDPFIKQIENTNKKPLLIKKVGLSFITAGVSHSAVIRNGCLYLWGKSQFGCCGLFADDFTNIPKLIPNPKRLDLFKDVLSISVKSVSCGAQHSLVLTDFGVYAFGSSRFGQLGLGSDVVMSRNPIIISELVDKDIVCVDCGQYHSLAISNSGVLWTWGWNVFGQLGHRHIDDIHTPQVVQYFKQMKIIQAFAGFGHTIALDCDGIVYSFGNGTYGQLGLGNCDKYNFPQKVSLFSEPIGQIVTKYFHSLALSRDNQTLYIWGISPQILRIESNCAKKNRKNSPTIHMSAKNCQNFSYLKPMAINISTLRAKIMKICTGSLHSLILTSDGNVYSFGRGSDGQLGHPSVKELKLPAKIAAMNEYNVIDIAAGSDYSLAMDISGNIWGFGNNTDSQIGPKKCSQNVNPLEEISKKISLKTNRKVLSFISGTKCTEELPIRIQLPKDVDSYCDSLNYSLDIHAMKTSTTFTIIDDNINALFDENSVSFDRQILASLLAFYRKDLDLNSVLNRFKNFKCNQLSAFVCELQNDFPNALDFQLQALELSFATESQQFSQFYTQIFNIFIVKSMDNIEKISKIFDIFVKFWLKHEISFDLLEILMKQSYKTHIKDSMFGISFFNYLKRNPNNANKFKSSFLLEMVDYTIKSVAKRPEKLFSYQTDIERITADIENISFPAEKLWQNILTHFQTNKDSNINTGVQFDAIDDEIIIFNCNHFYGFNEFKETIVTNFERDVEELEDKQTNSKDIEEMVKFYRDWDKELWDCMCPECFITHIKTIH